MKDARLSAANHKFLMLKKVEWGMASLDDALSRILMEWKQKQ